MVPGDRRLIRVCVAVIAVAVVVAAVCGAFAWRASRGDDQSQRLDVERATAAAVQELMSFSPHDDQARRRAIAERLTGALAADYVSRGPDVVFSGAAASRITMNTKVLEVGVAELAPTRARALVFADQLIAVGDDDTEPEKVGVSRWAAMAKVDGQWRLVRLEPVAPQ